ncbi:hypothetical protein LY78DRAFT_490224 [Colletotrichum sublineola]|nr:hypothetical protein LY78DRAFT_490224 [Colletotrichum sublineola]
MPFVPCPNKRDISHNVPFWATLDSSLTQSRFCAPYAISGLRTLAVKHHLRPSKSSNLNGLQGKLRWFQQLLSSWRLYMPEQRYQTIRTAVAVFFVLCHICTCIPFPFRLSFPHRLGLLWSTTVGSLVFNLFQ